MRGMAMNDDRGRRENTARSTRLRDIAEELGLSLMSVSVALRGMPGVSEATRKAVRACAKKRGYRPDPAMSALADYRRRIRVSPAFAQLAFVTDYPTKHDPFWGYTDLFLHGARRRGLEYGYDVVPFWLREGGQTRKQACSVMFNRGIKGLLIAPLPVEDGHLDDMVWKYFCAVAMGPSLSNPQLDQSLFDHHHAVQTALGELRARGYRRIGLAVQKRRDARVRHVPSEVYWSEQYRNGIDGGALAPWLPDEFTSEGFWRWFDAHRPDAILTDAPQNLPGVLKERGLKAPRDVGIVCYCSGPGEDDSVSAVIQNMEAIGEAAVDRLHTNLLRSAYGVPEHAHGSFIHGHWQEGRTLRRRGRTER